jgi:hypothetical protein
VNNLRPRLPWIVLGLLTATQVGIGTWRAIVLFHGALGAGVRPLDWSAGLGLDLLTCAAIAAVARWWLSKFSWSAFGLRFLLITWLLVLAHYVWALAAGGRLDPALTWVFLAILLVAGWWARRQRETEIVSTPAPDPVAPVGRGPAFAIAAAFFAMHLPHLFFNYSFTDAKVTWACRAFKLAERGSLTGILDCLNPAISPLHALTLWLGIRDPMFEGRLLPLLMFGAFALVFYGLLRRVAPQLAPWGLVWLLVTDQVLKGQVSSYSGVPEMLAIVIALGVAIDEPALASTRRFALLIAIVAGAVVALTRRDGFPEFLVAAVVLIAATRRWRDARLWAAIAASCLAYLSWVVRPEILQAVPAFPPRLSSAAGLLYQVEGEPSAGQRLLMLLNGAQGQILSHYGYGAFVWTWLMVALWARRTGQMLGSGSGAQYGIAGLAGWIATLGAYAALSLLGHQYITSLFVIRTGFGRHLVHFFPLCLLSATALAERLVTAERIR